jgi:hypothetical protein
MSGRQRMQRRQPRRYTPEEIDPVTKDFLADGLAQMREALLSGQLRGLMWDAVPRFQLWPSRV